MEIFRCSRFYCNNITKYLQFDVLVTSSYRESLKQKIQLQIFYSHFLLFLQAVSPCLYSTVNVLRGMGMQIKVIYVIQNIRGWTFCRYCSLFWSLELKINILGQIGLQHFNIILSLLVCLFVFSFTCYVVVCTNVTCINANFYAHIKIFRTFNRKLRRIPLKKLL